MNSSIVFVLIIILLYLKWLLIFLVLPFQMIYNRYQKSKITENRSYILLFLAVPYWLWEKLFRSGWERWMLFQVSLFPSCHIRKRIYNLLGVETDENVVFHFKTEIRAPYKLKIGRGTIIGDNALLDARCGLEIGDNVNLSSNVSIYTQQHDHRSPLFITTGERVIVKSRAWIGSNVIVLPGVTIGEGAVCCAGCVVTKNVEPYAVVAGIPAKQVNKRPKDLCYEFDGKFCRLY